jgi:hypothetical protein
MEPTSSLLDGAGQLPDDLREEAARALQKVGAYLGTRGDPTVMSSFKESPGIVAFALMTAGLAFLLLIIAQIGNYWEIRNNWAYYQCQPSVAPFASFYGHNLQDTMSFCVQQQVKEHAGGVIAPIYKGIAEVQGVVDGVFTKVEAVEGGIMGLVSGFENFVINFVNSFRLLGVRVRVAVVRIKEIFQRVHAIFIAFAYSAVSAIMFGENLVCNPLTVFVGTIAGVDICCFAPETQVYAAGAGSVSISALRVGDTLADGCRVTAVFEFDGTAIPMVSIRGVHVSTNHSLRHQGGWIAAGDHPDAIPVPSRPRIYCVNTTTNTIAVPPPLGDTPLVFTDYEETSDPAVAAAAQAAAEDALCGSHGAPVAEYGLGLDPALQVLVDGGQWRRVDELTVGDRLPNGARVTGLVREWCRDVRVTPAGSRVAAAQLMRGGGGGGWFRAASRFSERGPSGILCQVFLDTNDGLTVMNAQEMWSVRDYQEWHGEETQAPYDAWLTAPKVDRGRPGTPRPYDDPILNPFFLASRAFS